MLKYDVVIPMYNAEKYIGDALDSLIGSDEYINEVIIVNDGSTDDSVGNISFDKYGFKINLINIQNSGVSVARNVGLKNTKSEYIAFLDADDIWEADKLKHVNDYLLSNRQKNVGLVFSKGFHFKDNSDQVIDRTYITDSNIKKILDDPFVTLLSEGNIIGSPSGVVISQKVLTEIGCFDESLSSGEDTDFWMRIAEKFKLGFIDKPLVGIRIHDSNAQKNRLKMFRHQILFMNKWVQKINNPIILNKWAEDLISITMFKFPKIGFLKLIKENTNEEVWKKLYGKRGMARVFILGYFRILPCFMARMFGKIIRLFHRGG